MRTLKRKINPMRKKTGGSTRPSTPPADYPPPPPLPTRINSTRTFNPRQLTIVQGRTNLSPRTSTPRTSNPRRTPPKRTSTPRTSTPRRKPPRRPTPSRRRRTPAPRSLEIVPGRTTVSSERNLNSTVKQIPPPPPPPDYPQQLDQENLAITKAIDDYFKIIRLRHPSTQVNTHNDHLDKFIIGIMDIYIVDKGPDDETCSEELMKKFKYYINKEHLNPLNILLYIEGSERGTLNLKSKLNEIISLNKQLSKKIFIRKLFFRLTNEYFKNILEYQITIYNKIHKESRNSEKGIEKNLDDIKYYNLRKSDTLFSDAHGKSLNELFTIPKKNNIIVYGRYGSKIYSHKISNILGGVSELNKSVFQTKSVLKKSIIKLKSIITRNKRVSHEEFLFLPEKLKSNSDFESGEDYSRHIYNGILKEGTCDMMPNAKLYFSCNASFSYIDKENIYNFIYQKQGIFMYDDKDFKRETGSVYAGDLVVDIRDLEKDIDKLIELLLSDETKDITAEDSVIYLVKERIKYKFRLQKNQFFVENFDNFILKKKDFYFTHLKGKGLIFEEVKDIENYKQILKNNILDFMAIHTEFTDEEIYKRLWIKSENLISLMKVNTGRGHTEIESLKEKKYKELCIYLIEKRKAGIKLNEFIELIIKYTGGKIKNFVPFMCRGFSDGKSVLEEFLKDHCGTSRGSVSRVSSFKKTNQKSRPGGTQPKPIISTVDCLNSSHWGIKCGTKFKTYSVRELKKIKGLSIGPSPHNILPNTKKITNQEKISQQEVNKVLTNYRNNMANERYKPPSSLEARIGSFTNSSNNSFSTNTERGSFSWQKFTPGTPPREINAGGAKRTKKKKRKKYKSKKKI